MEKKELVLWVNDYTTGRVERRRIVSDEWSKDIVFEKRDREIIISSLKPNIDKDKALEKLLNIIKGYVEERISLISSTRLYSPSAWNNFKEAHLRILECLTMAKNEFCIFNPTEEQTKEFSAALNKIRKGAQSVIELYDDVIKPEISKISKGGKPIKDPERRKFIRSLAKFYDKYSPVRCTVKIDAKQRTKNPKRFFKFIDACIMPIERKPKVTRDEDLTKLFKDVWIKKKKKTFHDEITRTLGVK